MNSPNSNSQPSKIGLLKLLIGLLSVICLLLGIAVFQLLPASLQQKSIQTAIPSPQKAVPSDLEVRGTFQLQDESFLFTGHVTNTGKLDTSEIKFKATLSDWSHYRGQGGDPVLQGYTVDLPVDSISNLRAGETRELEFVVPREFDYIQLDRLNRDVNNYSMNAEQTQRRFFATGLKIQPLVP